MIPAYNLAYPVLININNGSSGSGFLLNTSPAVFFITAKHVLFDNEGNLIGSEAILTCQNADISVEAPSLIHVDLSMLERMGFLFSHREKDVAGFSIGQIREHEKDFAIIPGVNIPKTSNSAFVMVSALNAVKLLKDVTVSEDIFLYGYPSSIGLKELPQFDYSKPLLRKGIVANLYKSLGTIILDCPVYYGNSGGPVIQVSSEVVQRGDRLTTRLGHYVVGVVSQFVPYTERWVNHSNGLIHTEMYNSSYSVAIAMDYVFEMLPYDERFKDLSHPTFTKE